MNILITGAKGFAGRNLVANLYTIKDGKNKTRPSIQIDEIFEYDIDSTPEELREYCSKADFVFHLAGINRPKEASEFSGNFNRQMNLFSFDDDKKEKILLSLKDNCALDIDSVCNVAGIPYGEAAGLLLELELEGRVKIVQGNRYISVR